MEESFLEQIDIDTPSTKPIRKHRNVSFVPTTVNKGGYRPVLIAKEFLAEEAIQLADQMKLIRELHAIKKVSDPDIVVLYLIMYLNLRYPGNFLANNSQILKLNESDCITPELIENSVNLEDFLTLRNEEFGAKLLKYKSKSLFDIVNNFNFYSVPYSARVAIVNWYLSNHYQIRLIVDRIPSSRDVLAMQAVGHRCVSVITLKLDDLILNERDPLSFMLHDLVHAYKMFNEQTLLKGQWGFSCAIMKIYKNHRGEDKIQELCDSDEEFRDKFDYLISDMNSHPKHLFYYFKAILINYFKKKYQEIDGVLKGKSLEEFDRVFESFLEMFEMNEMEKNVARKLLMPVENVRVKGSDHIDFTLLDNYFINLLN